MRCAGVLSAVVMWVGVARNGKLGKVATLIISKVLDFAIVPWKEGGLWEEGQGPGSAVAKAVVAPMGRPPPKGGEGRRFQNLPLPTPR